jgi:hypothetical protein
VFARSQIQASSSMERMITPVVDSLGLGAETRSVCPRFPAQGWEPRDFHLPSDFHPKIVRRLGWRVEACSPLGEPRMQLEPLVPSYSSPEVHSHSVISTRSFDYWIAIVLFSVHKFPTMRYDSVAFFKERHSAFGTRRCAGKQAFYGIVRVTRISETPQGLGRLGGGRIPCAIMRRECLNMSGRITSLQESRAA